MTYAEQYGIACMTLTADEFDEVFSLVFCDCEPHFELFRLACESQNATITIAALDCLEKLMAHGCVRRGEISHRIQTTPCHRPTG